MAVGLSAAQKFYFSYSICFKDFLGSQSFSKDSEEKKIFYKEY